MHLCRKEESRNEPRELRTERKTRGRREYYISDLQSRQRGGEIQSDLESSQRVPRGGGGYRRLRSRSTKRSTEYRNTANQS